MVSLLTPKLEKTDPTDFYSLRMAIEMQFRSSSCDQLRCLVCESHGQVIVLRGRVDTYYLKQLAQEIVRRLDRNVTIANLVTVN